jgi:uncharacterized UBP type Zn finger protein
MSLLSAQQEGPQEINPFILQQVCGTMLTGGGDSPMNGETQEDAHEFITKLLQQVKKEQPEIDIEELFRAEFAEQQVCECGTSKTFTEEASNFNIPVHLQPAGWRVHLSAIVAKNVQDNSRFEGYRCENCGETGKWSTKDAWEGKRLITSPEYLIAHVSRGRTQLKGQRMEEVKLMTRIVPPMRKLTLRAIDNTAIRYHLVAMIEHHGKA